MTDRSRNQTLRGQLTTYDRRTRAGDGILAADPPTPHPGPATAPVEPAAVAGDLPGMRTRLTAVLMVAGALSQLPLGMLHPHHEQPNHSRDAFAEYAASADWVWVHLGQYVGALLLSWGLITLALSLARHGGVTAQLARLSAAAAIVTTAVFAVQMAVDGIALKAAVDHWAASSGAARATAYDVADAVRSVEKGLSALFHLNNGITLLTLGAALAQGGRRRALGWIGAASGAGFLVEAAVTARTGFSPEAATVALAPTLLLLVFLVGAAVSMWRGDTRGSSAASDTAAEGQPVASLE